MSVSLFPALNLVEARLRSLFQKSIIIHMEIISPNLTSRHSASGCIRCLLGT